MHKRGETACCVVLKNLRRFREEPDAQILNADIGLLEMQFALAMEYGFKNWAEMKAHVTAVRDRSALGEIGTRAEVSSENAHALMSLRELENKTDDELIEIAREHMLENAASIGRKELAFKVLQAQIEKENAIFAEGVLEMPGNCSPGYLSPSGKNCQNGIDHIQVPGGLIRRYKLKNGDIVSGRVVWRSKWRYYSLYRIEAVNHAPPENRSGVFSIADHGGRQDRISCAKAYASSYR